MSEGADPFSRVDYRRLIAWPQRLEREAPFLLSVLAQAPRRRLLDLGCGTGEHARFLAEQGFTVVGIDRSPSMLEKARDRPLPANLTFVEGDLTHIDELVEGASGGALSLGNTLPHLRDEPTLARFLAGLRRRLLPGAPFLLQIVNYDKVFARNQRHLPLNVRPGETAGEEVVFLRLMTPGADGRVLFNPTTLCYRPGAEPPVVLERTKNVELRGWRRHQLERLLAAAGFTEQRVYGGMQQEPYEPLASPDLVLVAR